MRSQASTDEQHRAILRGILNSEGFSQFRAARRDLHQRPGMKSDIGTQQNESHLFWPKRFFSAKKIDLAKKISFFFSGFQCHFSSRDVDVTTMVWGFFECGSE